MKNRGKRYQTVANKVDLARAYPVEEALGAVKEVATANFDETVEVAVRLGVDPRHGDQMVRGTVLLPHGSGKSPRVAVFAKGEKAQEATAAGAEVVGAEELVQKIQEGWKDFDILVATREMMGMVGRLGKKLGPRMPNPKAGTVTEDIAKTVRDLKSGKMEFRMDKGGIVHLPIGKVSYPLESLVANFAALVAALLKAKPAASKGQYLRKICVCSTMGPGIPVDPASAVAISERAA